MADAASGTRCVLWEGEAVARSLLPGDAEGAEADGADDMAAAPQGPADAPPAVAAAHRDAALGPPEGTRVRCCGTRAPAAPEMSRVSARAVPSAASSVEEALSCIVVPAPEAPEAEPEAAGAATGTGAEAEVGTAASSQTASTSARLRVPSAAVVIGCPAARSAARVAR